ncbi:MAG: hypothetical protein E6I30_03370 [Chloroflexi bacterium]|nr:MAG: hypothetical protein E6I30_03370 [Chloroflexota bacterium]
MRLMVPAEFESFFVTSATVSSALIGLLFVSISINPQRIFGPNAESARQAQALSAFSALANIFFISLAALIPGIASISHRGGGKPTAFKAGIVKASAGGAANLIPVQEQRRAATRTHGFGHGGRRQPQQHSVHRGTSVSPHRSSQATRSRAATPPSGEHAHAKPTSKC